MAGGRYAAWLVVVVTIALPVGVVCLSPAASVSVVAGVLAGIPAGVLVSWLVYRLQRPQFVIEPIPGGTVGAKRTYWVHFRVRNVGGGFLGGGTAHGVECRLVIWENPISADAQTRGFVDNRGFRLKWDSRPDPLQQHVVGLTPDGGLATVSTPDLMAIDEAATVTIRPGRNKTVGAAFKMKGDSNAYVHQPEGFLLADWKNPDCRFPPGRYAIELVVESEETDAASFPFELNCSSGSDVPSVPQSADIDALSLRWRTNITDYSGYSPWPFG
jgi:hypothetical protein